MSERHTAHWMSSEPTAAHLQGLDTRSDGLQRRWDGGNGELRSLTTIENSALAHTHTHTHTRTHTHTHTQQCFPEHVLSLSYCYLQRLRRRVAIAVSWQAKASRSGAVIRRR